MLDSLEKICENLCLQEKDINLYSPLVLAYIGDACYELIIRSKLILESCDNVEKLHKKATHYVKAEAQKNIITNILEELTDQEMAVYKRARNAKCHTSPKNAKLGDYHKATGFEAVIGYLYLTKNIDRMLYLISKGLPKKDIE